jgi:surface antigen
MTEAITLAGVSTAVSVEADRARRDDERRAQEAAARQLEYEESLRRAVWSEETGGVISRLV